VNLNRCQKVPTRTLFILLFWVCRYEHQRNNTRLDKFIQYHWYILQSCEVIFCKENIDAISEEEASLPIQKPYYRICRPFVSGGYFPDWEHIYLRDIRYAADSVNFIRSYHLLEKDLYTIFEYVEPTDDNLECYSHQLYTLLLRACTEFEANAKAILVANGYSRKKATLRVEDYYKINVATRLDKYMISIPIWQGNYNRIQPFQKWSVGPTLSWYQAYNKVKHSRSYNFDCASLKNVINAVGAVFAILFAQFNVFAFDPHHPVGEYNIDGDALSYDNCRLTVEPPKQWQTDEHYDFDWTILKNDVSPFQSYPF